MFCFFGNIFSIIFLADTMFLLNKNNILGGFYSASLVGLKSPGNISIKKIDFRQPADIFCFCQHFKY